MQHFQNLAWHGADEIINEDLPLGSANGIEFDAVEQRVLDLMLTAFQLGRGMETIEGEENAHKALQSCYFDGYANGRKSRQHEVEDFNKWLAASDAPVPAEQALITAKEIFQSNNKVERCQPTDNESMNHANTATVSSRSD